VIVPQCERDVFAIQRGFLVPEQALVQLEELVFCHAFWQLMVMYVIQGYHFDS